MRIPELREEIVIPDKVEVTLVGSLIKVKGPKGELERMFNFPRLKSSVDDGKLVLIAKNATRREKTQLGTMTAHSNNMIKGVTEGHAYKMKICSGHFPMNVSMNGDVFTVKNFLGEKVPRTFKVKAGVDVKIDGNDIIIESIDIEKAGMVAAGIEQLTRITNRDIRIFQDGIYIVEKHGKPML